MPAVSVIVPLAAGESSWQPLLAQLLALAVDKEILLMCADSQDARQISLLVNSDNGVSVLVGNNGRAALMNAGAAAANGKNLWFVHADTVLPQNCSEVLASAMQRTPALHYFDLAFLPDGPPLMAINAAGVYLRSHWLKIPFGDQAFLIEKQAFVSIGGFDEQVSYGEDHLLVWQAHFAGLPIKRIGACVHTSARKYRKQGWGRVTRRHLWLTVEQAWPLLLRLLKQRLLAKG